MTWTQFDAVQLVAWSIFIFREPHAMKRKEREQYDAERTNLVPNFVPGWIFPIVWTILKTLNVITIVLFSHYTLSTDHWAWMTVFALFFTNQALSKFWTLLFFRYRMVRLALVLAIILFLTALAILICMGVGRENCDFWEVPLILFCFYTAWLFVAIFLNGSWLVVHSDSGTSKSKQDPPLMGPNSHLVASRIGKFNHKANGV